MRPFTGSTSYLLVRLPAYAVNRTKRLIKAPKIYSDDTGTAMHLAETEEPGGAHLENLVLHDLLAWRDARIERAELGYWRTSIGEEVDVVIETGGKLLPIEVKSTARPRLSDAAHLRTFRAEYGKKTRAGLSVLTHLTLLPVASPRNVTGSIDGCHVSLSFQFQD
jgi:hypothetical protein